MMKCFGRMVTYVATALALCAVLFNFACTWFGGEGGPLSLAGVIMFEMRRSEALKHRIEAYSYSLEDKQRITVELINGRLQLREAIDGFLRLNKKLLENFANQTAEPGMIATSVPPPTDPKIVAHDLFLWVRAEVATWPPDKKKRLFADLQSEYHELFGCSMPSNPWTDSDLTRQDLLCNGEPHHEPR